jgi:hypothetical protein
MTIFVESLRRIMNSHDLFTKQVEEFNQHLATMADRASRDWDAANKPAATHMEAFTKTLALMNKHHQQACALAGVMSLLHDLDESQPEQPAPTQGRGGLPQQAKAARGRFFPTALRRSWQNIVGLARRRPDSDSMPEDELLIVDTEYRVIDTDPEMKIGSHRKE